MDHWYGGLPPHQTLSETPKRKVRIILHADFNTPSVEMIKELSWLPILKRLKYNKAVLLYYTTPRTI